MEENNGNIPQELEQELEQDRKSVVESPDCRVWYDVFGEKGMYMAYMQMDSLMDMPYGNIWGYKVDNNLVQVGEWTRLQ